MAAFKEVIERLKDKGTLILVATTILGLLVSLGVIDAGKVEDYKGIVISIVTVLSVVGIVREPKKKAPEQAGKTPAE
jgi:uncharacterized membrane protein